MYRQWIWAVYPLWLNLNLFDLHEFVPQVSLDQTQFDLFQTK